MNVKIPVPEGQIFNVIDFQIKFLDCVISRPLSTTHDVCALFKGLPSIAPEADQKHYLEA